MIDDTLIEAAGLVAAEHRSEVATLLMAIDENLPAYSGIDREVSTHLKQQKPSSKSVFVTSREPPVRTKVYV